MFQNNQKVSNGVSEKHQFIIPAVILVSVVGLMAAYGFIQAQTAWLRATPEPTLQAPGNAQIDGAIAIGSGATPGAAGTITTTGAINTAGGVILNTAGATNGLIVQSGNVGIGTTDPQGYKLKVQGDVYFTNNLAVAGYAGVTNTLSAKTLEIKDSANNDIDIKTYIAQLTQPFTLTSNAESTCQLGVTGYPPYCYGQYMQTALSQYGAFMHADLLWSCGRGNWCYFTTNGQQSGNNLVGKINLPANHGLSGIRAYYQVFGATDDTPEFYEEITLKDKDGNVETVYSGAAVPKAVTKNAWDTYGWWSPDGMPISDTTRTVEYRFKGRITGGSNGSGWDGIAFRFQNCNSLSNMVCLWQTDTPSVNNIATF